MAQPSSNELLEERLRRMILTNGPDSPDQVQNVPVVRLPPRPRNAAEQTQSAAYPIQQGPHHHPAGLARGGSSSSSNFRNAGPMPHHSQHSQGNFAPSEVADPHRRLPARHVQHNLQPQQVNPRLQRQWRQPQGPGMDSTSFNRTPQPAQHTNRPRQLYDPSSQSLPPHVQQQIRAQYLQSIADREIPLIEMSNEERQEKEAFRVKLQSICHELCASDPDRLPAVELCCFGSFQSGFASAGSDMDLVIVPLNKAATATPFSLHEGDLPRQLEHRLLQLGYGGRLLTRTRVPIIKVCELPGESLLSQLREERTKWDKLSPKLKYPHLEADDEPEDIAIEAVDKPEVLDDAPGEDALTNKSIHEADVPPTTVDQTIDGTTLEHKEAQSKRSGQSKKWERERNAGPLDFPKHGVGIQCDINFFNPLGLHNTQMLRCYSLCDPRVRPMILFVKAWAKQRKINSSYSGTLSSYGYVLMVLHYLINVVRPPVLPNLQQPWRPHAGCTPQGADSTQVDDWAVDFWRREDEIITAASRNMLTTNHDSLGHLLAGFFRYYAAQPGSYSFHWMQQTLSLRTRGGILSKEEKGWVKARTEESDGKKVQYRYLFCIEDPFELEHNVARTVTHFGIVAIRDEFRRANRILMDVGARNILKDGELFDALQEPAAMDDNGPVHVDVARVAASGQQQTKLNTKDVDAFPTLGKAPATPLVTTTGEQVKPRGKGTGKQRIAGAKDASQNETSTPLVAAVRNDDQDGTQVVAPVDDIKPKKNYRRRQRAQRKVVLGTDAT
ncbi:hypothetical protein AMS68_000902 [Peltaster fructicola]|uniref:polynucleotide adenylyltransferase n=1 Tax=Peltaster fructicola TaxID=286661 RepID=A0A6H0XL84_9PEZI|nr:hypothetical protein AMS68_000902 [Peltaster fructicola]